MYCIVVILALNHIGPEAGAELAVALEQNNTLIDINLSKRCADIEVDSNSIGKGAIKIANALKVNAQLKELFLSKNNIQDEGATAFGEALAINKTLRTLHIGT